MSETVRFVASAGNRGNGDPNEAPAAEEMHEFITFQRQLSRPTDHYRPNRLVPGEGNPYAPPPKASHTSHTYLSKFLRDPIATSLNSFSKVTNYVTSPTFYDEEYLSSLPSLHLLRPPGYAERVNRSSRSPTPGDNEHPVIDPMTTSNNFNVVNTVPLPPPALPPIPCTQPQCRLPALTLQEFEDTSAELSIDDIIERIFRGVSLYSNP
jgi:hypothetical protein